MTKEVVTVLRHIPSLRHVPVQYLLVGALFAVIFAFFFIFFVIFLIADVIKTEKEEHKLPDSHKLIMDLQKTLINEMRGTSKQNSIMIWLTLLFILISVAGTLITVLGPEKSMEYVQQAISAITGASAKAAHTGKTLKVK